MIIHPTPHPSKYVPEVEILKEDQTKQQNLQDRV